MPRYCDYNTFSNFLLAEREYHHAIEYVLHLSREYDKLPPEVYFFTLRASNAACFNAV